MEKTEEEKLTSEKGQTSVMTLTQSTLLEKQHTQQSKTLSANVEVLKQLNFYLPTRRFFILKAVKSKDSRTNIAC